MKLGEYFKQAITQADWQQVCNVYKQITGETIRPPKVKLSTLSLADVDMDEPAPKAPIAAPISPADVEMPEETENTWVEEDEEEESEPTTPAEPPAEAKQQASAVPASVSRTSIDDFRVDRQPTQGENADGGKVARKEPISLRKKKNRFNDNQTIAIKDSVKDHPELGVQNPTPRGMRGKLDPEKYETASSAVDTGTKVHVICSMCGTEEDVSPVLAHNYHYDKPGTREEDKQNTYKCNNCSTGHGRAKLFRKTRN